MKKRLIPLLIIALSAILGCGLLTSCGDEYYWDGPGPGPGTNQFYDTDLTGIWKLVQADGDAVDGYNANYLEFFGNGSGRYYYYKDGTLYNENITYYCQQGTRNKLVNIRYASGGAATMSYWFSGRYSRLWMQWSTNQGTVTYLYDYTNAVP